MNATLVENFGYGKIKIFKFSKHFFVTLFISIALININFFFCFFFLKSIPIFQKPFRKFNKSFTIFLILN